MKIEMGESLFYSWLRHVKECQVVQTNWKVSPQWELHNEDFIRGLMEETDNHFSDKYEVFKNNSGMEQLLKQAEIDAIGILLSNEGMTAYAVDVAFHEGGLLYGSRQETVARIIKKCVRTAMCLYGYLDVRDGEIIFASPKIHNAVIADLIPCIDELNAIFNSNGLYLKVRIIANDDFANMVLNPILVASNGITDTSELFLRGYQLVQMFSDASIPRRKITNNSDKAESNLTPVNISDKTLSELKIGQIAQTVLRSLLTDDSISDEELNLMQTSEYSKKTFDLQYPLLVRSDSDFDSVRYYKKPLLIKGNTYYMCSQWFEVSANNDRPYLMKWISLHEIQANNKG